MLGTAFVTLLVEPTQASAPPGLAGIAATTVRQLPDGAALELPDDRPTRPAAGDGLAPLPSGEPAQTAAAPSEPPLAAPAPVAASGVRLRVGRLGIDLPLLPGDTVRDTLLRSTPNGAAFLLPSSAPLNSGGNSYVYAHARVGMFLSLWDVRLGDVVEVIGPSSEARRYVVTEIHPRVVPTDIRYTLPTGDERITLQTSTGPRDADPRFVVVAVRGS